MQIPVLASFIKMLYLNCFSRRSLFFIPSEKKTPGELEELSEGN